MGVQAGCWPGIGLPGKETTAAVVAGVSGYGEAQQFLGTGSKVIEEYAKMNERRTSSYATRVRSTYSGSMIPVTETCQIEI